MMHLTGDRWLVATLLYGAGLRLMEALRPRQRRGVRALRTDGAPGEGRQGPDHDVAASHRSTAARTPATRARDPPARCGGRIRAGRIARSLVSQVSEGRPRLEMAVRVPAGEAMEERADRRARTSSYRRIAVPKIRRRRRSASPTHEARHEPRASAFVRHASAHGRLRHSDGSGATGARRCEDDDDLHACAQSRRSGSPQPGRPTAASS